MWKPHVYFICLFVCLMVGSTDIFILLPYESQHLEGELLRKLINIMWKEVIIFFKEFKSLHISRSDLNFNFLKTLN